MGCPVTQLVGLTVLPHYRYLSPIIIPETVPLYDVPWDIRSTVGLTQYLQVVSPSPFHRRPYLILDDDDQHYNSLKQLQVNQDLNLID